MMVAASSSSSASLAELLSARAQSTPRSRLLIDIVGGALVAGVALWARPFAWFPVMAAAICLCAYGVWAIAERLLESADPLSPRQEFMLEIMQRGVAVLGLVAFLALLFGALGVAFGPVIS
jgi:hypothetical protein